MPAPPSPLSDSARRLLAGCDEEQREAIVTPARPLCVLAAAGSGKTRVLTRKIAWRVLEGSASARYVLALTFTRKAASELRGRLAALGLPEPVTAGTFHAVALAELRRLAAERGRSAPVVLASKARLLAVAAGQAVRHDHATLAALATEIEWARARCLTPRDYSSVAVPAERRAPLEPAEVAAVWTSYEREKQKRKVLDFDDLLARCASELEQDPDFAASAHWRFRHLFVDEYQDVNPAQLRLLAAWSGGRDDLCVVGDPDQAIYGWNGSDPGAINEFEQRHPGATVVRLGTNYRSTEQVLTVASSILGDGPSEPPARDDGPGGEQPKARRRLSGIHSDGPHPTITCYPTDLDEARGLAVGLRRARRAGSSWSGLAVLARTNAQLVLFEHELSAEAIPFRSGGGRAFLARPAVRGALAELQRHAATTGPAGLRAWLEDLELASDDAAFDDRATRGGERLEPSIDPDLSELARLGAEYLAADSAPSGDGLIAWLDASLRADPPQHAGDAVDLVTFHRAKGLEWPVVFVTGLEDGFVPIAHARHAQALAEERRLLYVACTRAERELHCSWAQERSFGARRLPRSPSPYLAAIEAAQLELARLSEMTPERSQSAHDAVRALLAGRARSGSPR